MNVTISREPCLLLEAMELVYSYMSQEPVDRLMGRGEYCIPSGEILRMRNELCRDLDLEDKVLQFYFTGVPLEEGMDKRNFCLASAILYTPMRITCRDVDEMARHLSEEWASMRKPRIISGINPFGLAMGWTDADSFRPFSGEVAKLPLPSAFQVQLVDVFTNYDHYLNRLVDFLRPLAKRLEPLLEPWVQRTQPLIDQWVKHMNGEDPLAFICNRTFLNSVGCQELSVAMRYFPAAPSYLRLWDRDTSGCFLTGIGMEVGEKIFRPAETLADWEIHALRQLANPDRIAMLQAMRNRYMSGTDLVQELGLHSGTVFRDLNNLGRAMLIDRELLDGKNVYRTNYARLRQLTQRVLDVIGPEEE